MLNEQFINELTPSQKAHLYKLIKRSRKTGTWEDLDELYVKLKKELEVYQ